jgi:hypothetical protein
MHCLNGKIPLTALNPAHVGSVQPAVIGKRLLRKASLQPEFANSASEYFLERWHF